MPFNDRVSKVRRAGTASVIAGIVTVTFGVVQGYIKQEISLGGASKGPVTGGRAVFYGHFLVAIGLYFIGKGVFSLMKNRL